MILHIHLFSLVVFLLDPSSEGLGKATLAILFDLSGEQVVAVAVEVVDEVWS